MKKDVVVAAGDALIDQRRRTTLKSFLCLRNMIHKYVCSLHSIPLIDGMDLTPLKKKLIIIRLGLKLSLSEEGSKLLNSMS